MLRYEVSAVNTVITTHKARASMSEHFKEAWASGHPGILWSTMEHFVWSFHARFVMSYTLDNGVTSWPHIRACIWFRELHKRINFASQVLPFKAVNCFAYDCNSLNRVKLCLDSSEMSYQFHPLARAKQLSCHCQAEVSAGVGGREPDELRQ